MKRRLSAALFMLAVFGAGLAAPIPATANDSYSFFINAHSDYCAQNVSVYDSFSGNFADYGHIISMDFDWTNITARLTSTYAWCGVCGGPRSSNSKKVTVTFKATAWGLNSCDVAIPWGVSCSMSGNTESTAFTAKSTDTSSSGYASVHVSEMKYENLSTMTWPSNAVYVTGIVVIGNDTYYYNGGWTFPYSH